MALFVLIVRSVLALATPVTVHGSLERTATFTPEERATWLEQAVNEVDDAVMRAQGEVARMSELQIRPCHTRQLARLERLQRTVQAGAADAPVGAHKLRRIAIAREKAVELSLHGACPQVDGVQWSVNDSGLPQEMLSIPYDPLYIEVSSPTLRLRW